MSNQIWRIVVLRGFRLFIYRACERALARTLETSERIVIGRGIAGEACQITNGNMGHAFLAVMTDSQCGEKTL